MTLDEFEQHLRPRTEHVSLSTLPNFPVSDFPTLQEGVEAGRLSIGIDFTMANELATKIYGSVWLLMIAVIAWTPLLFSVAAVIGAVASRQYAVLLVIPLTFLGAFLGNPYNPARKVTSFLSLFAVAGALWAFQAQRPALGWIALAFSVSYWLKRFLYRANQERLRRWALRSEVVTIALYEWRTLGVLDRETGQTYWAPIGGGPAGSRLQT
jgi:hypothetical protein